MLLHMRKHELRTPKKARGSTLLRRRRMIRAVQRTSTFDLAWATIAEDYALSQVCLQPIFEQRLSQEPDPAKRQHMARMIGAARATMLGVLAPLDAQHGGAARYLRAADVAEADLERLRLRIRYV